MLILNRMSLCIAFSGVLASHASFACGGAVATPIDADGSVPANSPDGVSPNETGPLTDAVRGGDTMAPDVDDAPGALDVTDDMSPGEDAGPCPGSVPTAGAACLGDGQGCNYSDGADPCGVYAICTGGVWVEHDDGC
jgi:hypothetical protein